MPPLRSGGEPTQRTKYAAWQEGILDNCGAALPQGDSHAYNDGSGGQGTADRRLRTCGWGVVFRQSLSASRLAFCGELPGAVQTAPRAEIASAQFAAAVG